jgi:ABC-type proline/glycine betaine transport system permease subunit
MLHTMKTDEALDPVAVRLFGLVSHISATNQCAQLIHKAGRVVWQLWWDIQNHRLSLHAVYLYSILGLLLGYFTVKNGDIRQLSQNFVNFMPMS